VIHRRWIQHPDGRVEITPLRHPVDLIAVQQDMDRRRAHRAALRERARAHRAAINRQSATALDVLA
jgi:hypothetical protein